jgi:SAM-dependent methyltransferase
MLAEARRHVRTARLFEVDLTRDSPWPAGSFDLVTAFRFFPNAEPDLRAEALAAIRRLLGPGGRLVFNNHEHLGSLRNRLKRLLRRPNPRRGMTHESAMALAAGFGFEVERVYPIGCWPGVRRLPRQLVPLLTRGERFVARHLPIRPLANNLVYVCRVQ